MRMTVRLVITMLQEQRGRVSELSLETLHDMLMELPLLALQGEPQDCIDSIQNWLLSVVNDTSDAYPVEISTRSMESLLALGLTTGSLSLILKSIRQLIQSFLQDSSDSRFQSLRIIPFLQQLEGWQVDLILSPLARDRLAGSWTIIHEADNNTSINFSPSSNNGSLTSNGSYIFLHDTCGLLKVGTGFLSETAQYTTIQGRIYTRNANWKVEERGWLACIEDKLYYRSPSTAPATLLVLNAVTLEEEGSIYRDGTGSIPTVDNSKYPFEPEDITDNRGNTRSPLVSDGRYLYILSHHRSTYGHLKFYVDVFDPLNSMKHTRRIKLRYPETSKEK